VKRRVANRAPRRRRSPRTPHPAPLLIIGHRGARGHAPENTLKSFDKALAFGAPWVELDVQLHRNALLVFHDERLERTTNGRGRLADHDLDYVRGLDAGDGERIPLLSEVLDRIDRRAGVNVELKTTGGTAAAVATLLREYLGRGWQPEDFMVSSFFLPELREFKRRLPEVPVGALLCGVPLDLAACGTELTARSINVALDFADGALFADARRRGLKVYVYTVNELDDAERMKALGADGIFSDYPDRFL